MKKKKMNVKFDKKGFMKKAMIVALLVLVVSPTFAQQGGAGIQTAADTIKSYWTPVKLLIQAIGGIVGLIGAVRIYNKWTNGDQDINKEIVGWGGACLFLIIAPQFINSFFNMA